MLTTDPLPKAAQLPGEGVAVPVADEVAVAPELELALEPETEAAALVKAISTPVLADAPAAEVPFR